METHALKVSIRFPSGRVEELIIDAQRAMVGSGAHCEVRLPPEEAEAEHLLLEVDASGVRGSVRAERSRPTMGGQPFERGPIAAGAPLEIGHLLVTVSPLGGAFSSTHQRRKRESGNPIIYALGAVGFPVGFYLLFAMGPEEQPLPASLVAPPLFATSKPAACPQAAIGSTLVLGQKARLEAESSRERAPFSPEDGITAVASFDQAGACFGAAGEAGLASDAAAASAALKTKLEGEFHVHQVRLERALATKRYEDARTEVQILLSFVGRQNSDYTRMLSSLERQIELKFSGKKGS